MNALSIDVIVLTLFFNYIYSILPVYNILIYSSPIVLGKGNSKLLTTEGILTDGMNQLNPSLLTNHLRAHVLKQSIIC